MTGPESEQVTGEVVETVTVTDHDWSPRQAEIYLRNLEPGTYKLVRCDDDE